MSNRRRGESDPSADVRPIIVGDQAGREPACRSGEQTVEVMARTLERQRRQFQRLRQIIEKINRGQRLEEVLDFIYDEFRDVMPYNRISFASIDYEQELIVARWARSDKPQQIVEGYSRGFSQTTLMNLARAGRPRIINDLAAYADQRADSETVQMLIEENLRSSLTCPLVVDDRAVGFLFFDSERPNAYTEAHAEFFAQIAGVVSVGVQRGMMFSQLAERNRTIEEQNRLLALENEHNQQELELARKVQMALIPDVLPESDRIRMATVYEPAEQIGGDALDAVLLKDGCLVVFLADAMGHGVPAALLMSVVTAVFRMALVQAEADRMCSPARVLQQVNEAIVGLFEINYVTAFCAVLNPQAGQLAYSVAGHPPGLIRRAAGAVEELGSEGGIPMGIKNNTSYSDVAASFDPGDLLLLYTDGVIEAVGSDGSHYGLDRLKQFLSGSAGESAQKATTDLKEELGRHCGCTALEDDMTVLALKLLPER